MRIVVNYGPMFAGKSTAIYEMVTRNHPYNTIVFKPITDTRDKINEIVTHDGEKLSCFQMVGAWGIIDKVKSVYKMLKSLQSSAEMRVIIDEFQFFPEDTAYTLRANLKTLDINLFIFGLDQYSDGREWPAMKNARDIADVENVFSAVCAKCGSIYAKRTQKLKSTGNATEVGGKDLYEPRCDNCWEPRT